MDSTGPSTAGLPADDELTEELKQPRLNPMDKAEKLGILRSRGHTVIAIARATGMSDTTVSNYLSLLELDPRRQRQVRSRELSASKAIAEARELRKEMHANHDGATLGQLIQGVMDQRRWNLRDVARAAGVPYQSLWHWVGGTRSAKPENLRQLAAGLGLSEAAVFRAGGRAYDHPDELDDSTLQIVHLYQELAPEDRTVVEQLARNLAERARPDGKSVSRQ